jgi:hypothetical protein
MKDQQKGVERLLIITVQGETIGKNIFQDPEYVPLVLLPMPTAPRLNEGFKSVVRVAQILKLNRSNWFKKFDALTTEFETYTISCRKDDGKHQTHVVKAKANKAFEITKMRQIHTESPREVLSVLELAENQNKRSSHPVSTELSHVAM